MATSSCGMKGPLRNDYKYQCYNAKHMQFGSFTLDANVYVFVILGGFLLMAFMFGEARLKRIALGLLAGLLAADQLTDFAMTQTGSIIKITDPAVMSFILLLAVAVPLSLGKTPSVGGRFSIRSFALAILTAAALIAYTHSYLGSGVREQLIVDYNLVAIASNNKSWWLSGLLIWLIVLQLWKKKAKLDDDDPKKKGKKGRKKR